MIVSVKHKSNNCFGTLTISGSKSESNRLLILKALYPEIEINNLSSSDDTKILLSALETRGDKIDVNHAGTAMRFLTAFFSSIPKREVIITGSNRMQERPIKILVDALTSLGCEIKYIKNEGFPPLKIFGKKLLKSKVTLKADISSQYISALMLIAPSLKNGLEINLREEIVSEPYVKMTTFLLRYFGINVSFLEKKIIIDPKNILKKKIKLVESDWSSASYYFSIVSLSEKASVSLKNFNLKSLQGDSILVNLYKKLGVDTSFKGSEIKISKIPKFIYPKHISLNLQDTPDIAQTIAVSCFGLGINCKLTGLKTLKIKETDRLAALKKELEKVGAKVNITKESINVSSINSINKNIKIDTYNDHRMAMAFAPLGLKSRIYIDNPEIVSKSYPEFWNHLTDIGFKVERDVNFKAISLT